MAAQGPSSRGRAERVGKSNERRDSVAIAVVGAGAPHAGLMAGALAYMHRHSRKTFDVFFTSGGGALIGLLFVAPKDKRADEALREVAEFGVDDRIYRVFPVGYKTFFKNSPFTDLFREWAHVYKLKVEPRPFPGEKPPADYDPRQQSRRRLYNDWVDFWFAALTPPSLNPRSVGLCSHLPFLESMVDFERVNRRLSPSGFDFTIPVMLSFDPPTSVYLNYGWFYVNAYNLETKSIQQFSNAMATEPRPRAPQEPLEEPSGFAGRLTPDAIRAALSFPLVYPPQKVDGASYCEGADVDPLNLPNVAKVVTRRDAPPEDRRRRLPKVRVFLFDILGALEKDIMFSPRDLWEAYGLSILTPVVSLAKMSETIYNKTPGLPELISVPFEIPRRRRDRPLDWSYDNTTALWDAGWAAGKKFLDEHGDELPDRRDD